MKIKVLASGSTGNCYLINDGYTSILLECGIPIKDIKNGLNYKLSDVSACLITHEHKDHCKALEGIIRHGIDVYMSDGTRHALKLSSNLIHTIFRFESHKIGSFEIMPFDTQHDAEEPLGYLIYSSKTGEKLLFATDTYYIKYKFKGLTHIMVECNYALDTLEESIERHPEIEARKDRLLQSHFELENVKEFLRSNDLSQVKEIYLLHLSGDNSDEIRFKKEIQELTGKIVTIA